MKLKSIMYSWMPAAVVGVGMATLMFGSAGTALAQTADLTINSFDSGISGVGNWYGSGVYTFDPAQDSTGNGGGSLYITSLNDSSSDTPLNPYICIAGGNPWYNAGSVDLTLYKSIEFDIKWDNTSAITVDQYNNTGTLPAIYGPVGSFNGDPYQKGFNLKAVSPVGPSFIQLGSTNIPTAASNGWVHISFPIDTTIAGIGLVNGIDLEKYIGNSGAIVGSPVAHFWIDNLVLKGTAGPPPPPTIKPLAKAAKGFNVIFNTGGQYDRHEARLQDQQGTTPTAVGTGKSWVGHATAGNPVSYTFTINSFPPIAAANSSGCEAYLFLVPNPANNDNAPDWNEPNCVVAYIQEGTNTATFNFQYKINEPNNNGMYGGGTDGNNPTWIYTNAPGSWNGVTTPWYESGSLGSVTVTNSSPAGAAVGTWTMMFTSDTNITLIGPDGTSSSFVMPPYNVANFAETTGFNVYLGGQPNQTTVFNDAVVYSSFAVSNTVTPFYDNFLADTSLSTNWDTSVSSGPSGKLVVPATATYWASWTLPAAGFGLETGSNLNSFSTWTSPNTYPLIGLNGSLAQLVDKSDLPVGQTAFFNLIKRTFTQLQILLPGQTNAPGTALGYVGTPTPQSVSTTTPITVNAVDSTFHIINGVYDQIHITTSDTSAFLPNDTALNNGTVTISGLSGFQFGTQPATSTITATDTTTTTIAPVTSAPVSVGP